MANKTNTMVVRKTLYFVLDVFVAGLILAGSWVIMVICLPEEKNWLHEFVAVAISIVTFIVARRTHKKKIRDLEELTLLRKEVSNRHSTQHNPSRHDVSLQQKSIQKRDKKTNSKDNAAKEEAKKKEMDNEQFIMNARNKGSANVELLIQRGPGNKTLRFGPSFGGEVKGWGSDFYVTADSRGQVWSFDIRGQRLGSMKYNPDYYHFGGVNGNGFSIVGKGGAVQYYNNKCRRT